ncbi:hypothetical protein GM556_02450 [Bombella sp. ESL0378]|nr:hypothetical protein [Bombella sp. ESL0378]MUG89906.1 hypothetical protein [Bombella sp. ESL0385]
MSRGYKMTKKTISRDEALHNLRKYIGHDLGLYAEKYNITIEKDGKINKGWKGQVLEQLAGLDNNNIRAPDGGDFELKSVVHTRKGDKWDPKETMAITMIDEASLAKEDDFYKTHLWSKLEKLICCATSFEGSGAKTSKLLSVTSFEFLDGDETIKEIKKDYEDIREKSIKDGFHSLSGKDGTWIQPRTKGQGGVNPRTGQPNPKTRAFYARKDLVRKLFEPNAKAKSSLHKVSGAQIGIPLTDDE